MRQFLLTLTALTAVLSLTAPALAQTQVFEQNVVITMGQRESQEDVRVYALAECKRLTLEKVGVYLQAETDLVQKVRESSRDSQSDTDFQKRLLAVTAGVTQTEVVGEWWVVQGTSLACSLTCRVTVDPDDIQRRIEELLKDKQKVEDQQELLKEVSRLREEMAELRQTLESAPKEKTEAIKAEVKQTVAGFTAADWVQLGIHSTDLDSQIVYFSRAIEIGGLTSEALISLYIIRAGAFIKRRQIDNAIVDCDRCIQIDSLNPDAYALRGIANYGKGDYEAAIMDINKSSNIEPLVSANIFSIRGDCFSNKGSYEEALNDYNQAIMLDSSNASIYSARGRVFLNIKDYDYAVHDFNRAYIIAPEDIEIRDNLLNALLLLGCKYTNDGLYEEAISFFNRAILIDSVTTKGFSLRSFVYFKQGYYDKALADLNRVIQIDPNDAGVISMRGNIFSVQGLNDLAIADLDRSIQIDPNNAETYHLRGTVYQSKGLYDVAIADFDRALRIDPTKTEFIGSLKRAYFLRGANYAIKDLYDNAIADYDRALYIDPNDALIYKCRGIMYNSKSLYDKAISDFDRALLLDPNNAVIYMLRGMSYSDKDLYDNAIADYDRALRIDPNSAVAFELRGNCFSKKKSYDAAIADYDQALKLDPSSGSKYYFLRGLVYVCKGDIANARHSLEQARELGHPDAQRMIDEYCK